MQFCASLPTDVLLTDDWGIPAANLQDLNGSQDEQDVAELPPTHFKRRRQEYAPAVHVTNPRARGQLVDNEVIAALQVHPSCFGTGISA